MATKMYVPGPSLVFAQVGAGSTYVQVGFSEQNTKVITGVMHQDVNADYAASMPADQQMMGESVAVSLRLSRYNETVLTAIRQRLSSTYSSAPGMGLPGAIGSLMVAQENTFGLIVVSQYSALAQFSDMLPGIRIPKAFLAGDTEVDLGTGVKMPIITFRGIADYGLDGSYTLFDTNVSAVSSITIG